MEKTRANFIKGILISIALVLIALITTFLCFSELFKQNNPENIYGLIFPYVKNEGTLKGLSMATYIFLVVHLFILHAFVFVFAPRWFFIKHDYKFLLILGGLCLLSLIMIFVQKGQEEIILIRSSYDTTTFIYDFSWIKKLWLIVPTISFFSIPYILIIYVPQLGKNNQKISTIFAIAIISLAGLFILLSLSAQFDGYLHFFKALFTKDNVEHNVSPLWLHKNDYGFYLFLAISACLFLHNMYAHKWWLFIISAILFIFLIFSQCKTGILLSIILIGLYLIYRFFYTYKNNKKRNITALAIIGGVSFLVFISAAIGYIFSSTIKSFVNEYIFLRGDTLSTREVIQDKAMQISSRSVLFFGEGFGNFESLLYRYCLADTYAHSSTYVTHAHNAWIQLLGQGGIILFTANLLLLGIYIYFLIKYYRNNIAICSLSLIFFLIYLLYSQMESISLFFTYSCSNMLYSALITAPIFALYYQEKIGVTNLI